MALRGRGAGQSVRTSVKPYARGEAVGAKVLKLSDVASVEHFRSDQPAGARRESHCRVHDGDVGAASAGQGPDDRQTIGRHRSHADANIDKLDVLREAEGLLETLQGAVRAVPQLVLVRLSGVALSSQQQTLRGLADLHLRRTHDSPDHARRGVEADQDGRRRRDGQIEIQRCAERRRIDPRREHDGIGHDGAHRRVDPDDGMILHAQPPHRLIETYLRAVAPGVIDERFGHGDRVDRPVGRPQDRSLRRRPQIRLQPRDLVSGHEPLIRSRAVSGPKTRAAPRTATPSGTP